MRVPERMFQTIQQRGLASRSTPVVLMVSGGSDSTALAYAAHELQRTGELGALAMVHINHMLRGADADADETFVQKLAQALDIPLVTQRVDVSALAEEAGQNVEALARRIRYDAAHDALASLCRDEDRPYSEARIFVAHTTDDRVENFYMRSIVGTGPGGFRSMRYLNGQIARPFLDLSREDLRVYIKDREQADAIIVRTPEGALWCEDATNSHTDRFRAFVRHEIIPLAKEQNPQLLQTLSRTMNQIADEDDMLNNMSESLFQSCVETLSSQPESFLISPTLADEPLPLQRRVVAAVLRRMLGVDARIESASIDAVLAGFEEGRPLGGYVANIQGDIAVSANRKGIRIEPMEVFRKRRNRL